MVQMATTWGGRRHTATSGMARKPVKAIKHVEPGTPLRVKLLTWIVAAGFSIALAGIVVSAYIVVRFGPQALSPLLQRALPFKLPFPLPF